MELGCNQVVYCYLDSPAALFQRVQLSPGVEHARGGRVRLAPLAARQRALQSEWSQDHWGVKTTLMSGYGLYKLTKIPFGLGREKGCLDDELCSL